MLLQYLILVHLVAWANAAILKCGFEDPCLDFTTDLSWGITNGLNPRPLNHDHTWNNQTGHYLFFAPRNGTRFPLFQIQTSAWLTPSTDRALCFQLWYYTSTPDLIFSIQLLQGDDLALTRVIAVITGNQPSVTDWTPVQVVLPAEQIKIAIRLNSTAGVLILDDLTVDYCDEPRPTPSQTLFACDFESSCAEQLVSLPEYPYQWSTIEAKMAVLEKSTAPPVDYTFGNQSGHYTWLGSSNQIAPANVGHLLTRAVFNITQEQSFCLSFQYYLYGSLASSNLFVFTSGKDGLQRIWPLPRTSQLSYMKDQWTWGIINLPVGEYSLLFRMISADFTDNGFALDNIVITSCAYPSYALDQNFDLLSFAANFDEGTMDGMENNYDVFSPRFNFTAITSDRVLYPALGPTHDHTSNSSTGFFIYWNRQLPFMFGDNGVVNPSKWIQQNRGMCLRFAYFVNSTVLGNNATSLSVTTGGCYGTTLWTQSMDDSQGWQVTTIPVRNYACGEKFYFWVTQTGLIDVAVAFDDIEIAQCSSFDPPTTTTTTTTTTIITTTTTRTTTSASITSTSTTHMDSTTTTSDSTVTTTVTTTAKRTSSRPTSSASLLSVGFAVTQILLFIVLMTVDFF